MLIGLFFGQTLAYLEGIWREVGVVMRWRGAVSTPEAAAWRPEAASGLGERLPPRLDAG
jgi:hypothetical protein